MDLVSPLPVGVAEGINRPLKMSFWCLGVFCRMNNSVMFDRELNFADSPTRLIPKSVPGTVILVTDIQLDTRRIKAIATNLYPLTLPWQTSNQNGTFVETNVASSRWLLGSFGVKYVRLYFDMRATPPFPSSWKIHCLKGYIYRKTLQRVKKHLLVKASVERMRNYCRESSKNALRHEERNVLTGFLIIQREIQRITIRTDDELRSIY
jgi:hypothetical protein